MMFKVVFLALFIVSLGGCAALKKRHNVPSISEEVNLKSSIDQAISNIDFEEGEWPESNWWIQFKDDQLTRWMEQAIEGNLDLKAATRRVRSSEQEARKVRSVFFPQFNTSFDDNYEHLSKDSLDRFPPSRLPAVINQVNLRLNFEYEIDLFGKNKEMYRAAVGEARAQKAEMSQAYLMITTSLAEAYFDYQAILLRIEVQKDEIKTQEILLKLREGRLIHHLDDAIYLEKTVANLLQKEEALTVLEKDLSLIKSRIKILMGLSPDDEMAFDVPCAHFDRPFPVPKNLSVHLLIRRADLMMHIWKVEAAAHLIGASRAAFFPNINLAAFTGLETLSWNTLFRVDSFVGAIAPAVGLPLFTGGRLTAELEKSFADFDAAVFDYNSLILKAAKEVSDSLKMLEATNDGARYQASVVECLKKANGLTDLRFENGVSNYLDVMESRLELLKQVGREIDIQKSRHLAVLNLIRVLGGGYHENKVEVKIDE